jgi:uncharacterized membrane protein
MSVGDIFLLVIRWLHLLSATAWVGGSLFYLFVLRPALRNSAGAHGPLVAAAGIEFRGLVNVCIVVLVATGAVLAFDRLTEGVLDVPYAATLGLKSALSMWMFMQVQAQRRHSEFLTVFGRRDQAPQTGLRGLASAASGYNALVIIGVIVFFLSDLLKVLFEVALIRN